ncbi:MAG: hypothetical protein JWO13_2749 [Acidobacteriales bacterium]|nr:hypothetical protein [Terriglobales bacterium]
MEARDELRAMLEELERRHKFDFLLIFVSADGQKQSECRLQGNQLLPCT